MKLQHIKIIFTLIFAFSLSNTFAQGNKGNEKIVIEIINPVLDVLLNQPRVEPVNINDLKPRWYCPFFYTQDEKVSDGMSELIVSNFSMKPIDYRLVFYDHHGVVVKTYEEELPGKGLRYIELHRGFFNDDFAGSIELQSNSPAIFPTLHYTEEMSVSQTSKGTMAAKMLKNKIILKSLTLDWYQLDQGNR